MNAAKDPQNGELNGGSEKNPSTNHGSKVNPHSQNMSDPGDNRQQLIDILGDKPNLSFSEITYLKSWLSHKNHVDILHAFLKEKKISAAVKGNFKNWAKEFGDPELSSHVDTNLAVIKASISLGTPANIPQVKIQSGFGGTKNSNFVDVIMEKVRQASLMKMRGSSSTGHINNQNFNNNSNKNIGGGEENIIEID